MGIVVYGIPNCDTVKKARQWLAERGVEHRFHDFKKDGVPPGRLARWVDELGCEALVNRRGTTWRTLAPAEQKTADDEAHAQALMARAPSLIRRPVVEWGRQTTVGFDAAAWELLARG